MKPLTYRMEGVLGLMRKYGGCVPYELRKCVSTGTLKALRSRGLTELRNGEYWLTEAGAAYRPTE